MSFQKINKLDPRNIHPRNCVIFYNFSPKELILLKNVANLTGYRDQILLTPNHGSCLIKDILDNQLSSSTPTQLTSKAIIFNTSEPHKMNLFIENLKKCRLNRPLIALVTSTSINWDVETLLSNLLEERQSLSNNQTPTHF